MGSAWRQVRCSGLNLAFQRLQELLGVLGMGAPLDMHNCHYTSCRVWLAEHAGSLPGQQQHTIEFWESLMAWVDVVSAVHDVSSYTLDYFPEQTWTSDANSNRNWRRGLWSRDCCVPPRPCLPIWATKATFLWVVNTGWECFAPHPCFVIWATKATSLCMLKTG